MRYLVLICALLQCYLFGDVNGKSIPDYLEVCRKSEPDFSGCVLKKIEKQRVYMIKGIPELGLPPADPFKLPLMTVDKAVNNLVKIKAVLRDIEVTGGSNAIINSLKLDPYNMTGEIKITIPWSYLSMEYDVNGQLLIIPLNSKGFFRGNFTNTQIYVKGKAKLYQKEGVDYYKVDKIQSKIKVGNGYIKLTSKNPNMQFTADVISNFFNENPRRTMDAVNPIFVDQANDMYRVLMDQVLATAPASEWTPE